MLLRVPLAASCANQSGAVAPHSKNCAARSVACPEVLESGAKHRFGSRTDHQNARPFEHPAGSFVCEPRHERLPLLHPARCFFREPKRRCRAALQKLRGEMRTCLEVLECGAKHRFGSQTDHRNARPFEHPAGLFVCEPRHERLPLLHPARCFFGRHCPFGVRCEAPLWFANGPPERAAGPRTGWTHAHSKSPFRYGLGCGRVETTVARTYTSSPRKE